jgi:hypothetical protein
MLPAISAVAADAGKNESHHPVLVMRPVILAG